MKKSITCNKSVYLLIISFFAVLAGVLCRRWFASACVETNTLFVMLDAPSFLYHVMLLGFAVLGCLLVYFATPSGIADYSCIHGRYSKTLGILCRVASVLTGVLLAIAFVSEFISVVGNDGYAGVSDMPLPIFEVANYLKLILAPLSACFLFCCAASNGKKLAGISILCNAFTLWFAMNLLVYFVDTSSYINRFGRNMEIVLFVVCILALVYESRAYLTRSKGESISLNTSDSMPFVNRKVLACLLFLVVYVCALKVFVVFDDAGLAASTGDLYIMMGVVPSIERTILIGFALWSLVKLLAIVFAHNKQ